MRDSDRNALSIIKIGNLIEKLINAIASQKNRMDTMSKRITLLEQQIDRLENLNDDDGLKNELKKTSQRQLI